MNNLIKLESSEQILGIIENTIQIVIKHLECGDKREYDKYPEITAESVKILNNTLFQVNDFYRLYDWLSNRQSQEILLWYIKLRIAHSIIGNDAIHLFPPVYAVRSRCRTKEHLEIHRTIFGFKVNKYHIKSCFSLIMETWYDQTYQLEYICEPEEGDIIISAGAFRGETTLWFASKIGKQGVVHSFEPTKKRYKQLVNNVRRNHLSDNVYTINRPLWSQDNIEMKLVLHRKETENYLSKNEDGQRIKTLTVDTYVMQKNLKQIDFIKMDVEGSEYEALCGAQVTIKAFRPKLAICLYHRAEDLIKIPCLLKHLVPEYNLYLSHKSISSGEIVLFAVANTSC